ncbi:T9SS type B sorting domain-containing protein, partial [Flavobacterium luminosum]
IANIQYTFGGGATSANVTGLPEGVSYSILGNVVTISGTPTTTTGSPFTYTVTTVGGTCGTVSMSGTIAVNTAMSLNLICDAANSTSSSLAFDFSNVGQTSFTYSYTIDGGAPITGTHISPSNFTVTGLTLGQTVTFTLTANGVSCVPPQTVSCTTTCTSPTLTLTSAAGTNNQTICVGTAITPITYTFSGDATGANVTGLPAGVTYTTSGNTVTISGTPSTTTALTSNYVISTLGGVCGSASLNGSISVNTNPTLVLTSTAGSNNQSVCVNTAINTITYTFGGVATGANVTGLPAGVTATTSGNTVTINGTPTTASATPYTYSITTTGGSCGSVTLNGTIRVNALPDPRPTEGSICVNSSGVATGSYILDAKLDEAMHDFVWYFNNNPIANSNTATYTATAVGTYGVVAVNTVTGCTSPLVTATVGATMPATGLTITQSNYFSGNATLTVTVIGGTGTYFYQLDGGVFQSSNVFTNVSSGTHTVTVIDAQQCSYLTKDVLVIEYPKFFTPNGDGYHDKWFIAGLQNTDVIYIFDRFGKLIKQLKGEEKWDGTYNQQPLPSTDYWFTVDYEENGAKKQFRAHFALKR